MNAIPAKSFNDSPTGYIEENLNTSPPKGSTEEINTEQCDWASYSFALNILTETNKL